MPKRIPGSREEDAWLSDEQLAKCARADEADVFPSPVPTQMVSNGEYMPVPQTEKQKRVEARIQELADSASKKLGISRRQFLASQGGMAASFLAMNEVFGRFFDVSPEEMFEPAASAATGLPPNLFTLDDQTHLIRSSRDHRLNYQRRAISQGPTMPGVTFNPYNPTGLLDELGSPWTPWNPKLIGKPFPRDVFDVIHYIKSFFFDSQTTVAVLSNANASIVDSGTPSARPPKNIAESKANEILTAEQTVGVRNFVNKIAESTRLLAHGQLYPGVGNLEYMQYQIDALKPDSWKGYNVGFAAKVDTDPNSDMRQWRHDDEAVAYPTFELINKTYPRVRRDFPGFKNICVHKGLAPGPPAVPERGYPTDLPKAARDWPDLNFITYHSCIQPPAFFRQSLEEIHSGVLREGVPDISWTTLYAQLVAPHPNCYAELGTTFASCVITFPTVCAHILGQLMKYLGEDRIVFGSDSLWYGSPQWQFEALWRFEIPNEIRHRYGYPKLTHRAKRKILGLNSARLYGLEIEKGEEEKGEEEESQFGPVPANFESLIPDSLKTLLEFPGYASDNISKMKQRYAEMGGERSNLRYGWIRTKV
jgi:hypothetical protein